MKLERIYIENFGGLSRFELIPESGLTVIQAPNGYGKTTLAEFIRAMFYGFPRKGKTLEKSKRQKYTPWQGGKFGGSLDFEAAGKHYRVERTFGATPRSDTFALFDLESGRRSNRFTENLGLELFGLDAESFERSTYMPQIREQGSLTTDSIQAKLSNLVEDSGDLGNFERAMTALRTSRSSFIPYRGNGGTVARAGEQVLRLQTELDDLSVKAEEERLLCQRIEKLQKEQQELQIRQREICARLDIAGEQASIAAARREYEQLQAWHQRILAEMNGIERKYPRGLPLDSEVERMQALLSRYHTLAASSAAGEEHGRDGEQQSRHYPWQMVLLIFAGICAGAGILLLVWEELFWGLAVLAAGMVFLASGIGLMRHRKSEAARKNAEILKQRRQLRGQELGRLKKELETFFDRYGLEMPEDPERTLSEIRFDIQTHSWRGTQLEPIRRRALECESADVSVSEHMEDCAELRERERMLTEQVGKKWQELAEYRQKLKQLREQVDRIPQVREELEFWKRRCAEDRKQAELLDATMSCLDEARQQLQNSYTIPLRQAFAGYMKRLLNEDVSQIMLSADLQVQLQRYGAARELGFFSAGQEDLVMLCMRLALVDALFTAEKPFVILDDPFVNLDDDHTRQALELIRELARDRQMIYLVCNSSRDPETM